MGDRQGYGAAEAASRSGDQRDLIREIEFWKRIHPVQDTV
jgi:hypothetical protein